ncbi:MAG: hypothetical protein AAGB31_06090 [Bdellovibrio sp.]
MKRTFTSVMLLLIVTWMGWSLAEAEAPKKSVPAAQSTTHTHQDVVKKMRDDEDGVVILFVGKKGSFYLRREEGNFTASYEKLRESFNGKKPVSVTFDSVQLNILEVK